jgi:hypothetical protein
MFPPSSTPMTPQRLLDLTRLAMAKGTSVWEANRHAIGEEVLRKSTAMKQPNFQAVQSSDLRRMVELYDAAFFDGGCLELARRGGIEFRWSRRMTSAGGKTTRWMLPSKDGQFGGSRYEITLSAALLYQSFQKEGEQVKVCGKLCWTRLEAMQRVVEHELIHLLEMLVWIDSNCAAKRFQSITSSIFGHTEHRHELTTQHERAIQHYQIQIGSRVSFAIEGKRLYGIVHRITRRATVLVEDGRGTQYTDGKRYCKYYVPLPQLRRES